MLKLKIVAIWDVLLYALADLVLFPQFVPHTALLVLIFFLLAAKYWTQIATVNLPPEPVERGQPTVFNLLPKRLVQRLVGH